MARYSFVGTATRIIALLLLVVILAIAGILWLNYLGVINARDVISPVLKSVGLQKKTEIEDLDDPLLLDKRRLMKEQEELALQLEELGLREEKIVSEQAILEQRTAELEEKEKDLEDREKSFNEKQKAFEDRRVNLEQNAGYFVGMRPEKAVAIILSMEDTDIVDIFRIVEEQAQAEGTPSMVSYWLSLMPADRAATLTRKMAKKISE